MIQFHSQTFLEQIGAELRLRIREPSYNAMIQSPADQLSEEREISGSLIGKQNETLADKAGFSNHIPANERGSEADSDSPLRSARDIDWIGNGTPVSYASEKPRGETGKAGPISTPAKPNVVSVVVCRFLTPCPEILLLILPSFHTFILFLRKASYLGEDYGAKNAISLTWVD